MPLENGLLNFCGEKSVGAEGHLSPPAGVVICTAPALTVHYTLQGYELGQMILVYHVLHIPYNFLYNPLCSC